MLTNNEECFFQRKQVCRNSGPAVRMKAEHGMVWYGMVWYGQNIQKSIPKKMFLINAHKDIMELAFHNR